MEYLILNRCLGYFPLVLRWGPKSLMRPYCDPPDTLRSDSRVIYLIFLLFILLQLHWPPCFSKISVVFPLKGLNLLFLLPRGFSMRYPIACLFFFSPTGLYTNVTFARSSPWPSYLKFQMNFLYFLLFKSWGIFHI